MDFYMVQKTKNYNIKDDVELREMLKNDIDGAFTEIVSRHFYALYHIALNIVKSHYDAEEVVWEALKKAHQSLPNFRGDVSVFMWLRKITINQAYNKLKWNCSHGSKVNIGLSCLSDNANKEYSVKESELIDYKYIPYNEINNHDLGQLLVKLIKSLPHTLQKTVHLFFLHRLPYHEIAKRQHCQLGTVKSRLSRARKILLKNCMPLNIYPNF